MSTPCQLSAPIRERLIHENLDITARLAGTHMHRLQWPEAQSGWRQSQRQIGGISRIARGRPGSKLQRQAEVGAGHVELAHRLVEEHKGAADGDFVDQFGIGACLPPQQKRQSVGAIADQFGIGKLQHFPLVRRAFHRCGIAPGEQVIDGNRLQRSADQLDLTDRMPVVAGKRSAGQDRG